MDKKEVSFGMCFSKDFEGVTPLDHIGRKFPVYVRLLEKCREQGWNVYVLTRKTYIGNSVFNGAWLFNDGEFSQVFDQIKIDLVFDWVGNLKFPPLNEPGLRTVNTRKFKEMSCDKWKMYERLKEFMPKTVRVGDIKNLDKILPEIATNWVVIKPVNGLKGKGIFVGPKSDVKNFEFDPKFTTYIAQEFVDTSGGIPGLTEGFHDLRVVVTNKKPVWCHVRVPPEGTYKANVGQGGSLTEIEFEAIPEKIKQIIKKIAPQFYKEFDNPLYSLDFGVDKSGRPYIFEINDQMGFPQWGMKNMDLFLNALVENFSSKI